MMTTPIALDSNALRELLPYGADIYEQVTRGALRVYVPVLVYAEQVIHPASVVQNLVDAFRAEVVPLRVDHADHLGVLWRALPDPFAGHRKQAGLWRQHQLDWLIAAMSWREGWTVITNDRGPAFQVPQVRVLQVTDFVKQHLAVSPPA